MNVTRQFAPLTCPNVPPDLIRLFLPWLCYNKHIHKLACASLITRRQRFETSEPNPRWGESNKRLPEKSNTAKPSQHMSTQPRHHIKIKHKKSPKRPPIKIKIKRKLPNPNTSKLLQGHLKSPAKRSLLQRSRETSWSPRPGPNYST